MQPLQILRPELVPPAGRDFFTRPQRDGELPTFTMKEVASIFLAHQAQWLYRQIKAGKANLDGQPVEVPYTGQRYHFQLNHIERIAHAFFISGIISINEFENMLLIVKAIASNYRLI